MTRSTMFCFVFGLIVGTFFWGGCASESQGGLKQDSQDAPVDLTKWHADTHPELRIGLNPLNNWRRQGDPPTSYKYGD